MAPPWQVFSHALAHYSSISHVGVAPMCPRRTLKTSGAVFLCVILVSSPDPSQPQSRTPVTTTSPTTVTTRPTIGATDPDAVPAVGGREWQCPYDNITCPFLLRPPDPIIFVTQIPPLLTRLPRPCSVPSQLNLRPATTLQPSDRFTGSLNGHFRHTQDSKRQCAALGGLG